MQRMGGFRRGNCGGGWRGLGLMLSENIFMGCQFF